MSKTNTVEELPEDIEVIGPGQMLAEARKKQKLTQQQVADKLNFRTSLVKDIESEKFDKSLPDTFNRGYLKNYAKLVNISCEDVLASYEMLNVAEKQGAEMQSFSRQTEKQAENNRIVWISYLILAMLVGSTVVWWFQDSKENIVKPVVQEVVAPPSDGQTVNIEEPNEVLLEENTQEEAVRSDDEIVALSETLIDNSDTLEQTDAEAAPSDELAGSVIDVSAQLTDSADAKNSTVQEDETTIDYGPIESAQFTFSGDCWVNIYDATGERIAWGIKKTGYVMNLTGQAPFDITLGKPELVEILFEQQSIDMSQFSQGNIAKFSLPLAN